MSKHGVHDDSRRRGSADRLLRTTALCFVATPDPLLASCSPRSVLDDTFQVSPLTKEDDDFIPTTKKEKKERKFMYTVDLGFHG